jgi:hypothetical protein
MYLLIIHYNIHVNLFLNNYSPFLNKSTEINPFYYKDYLDYAEEECLKEYSRITETRKETN